jgi:condensin complex subunit 1
LAMTKLMCVSAQYCEAHLPLLFKILETSRDPVVRSNIVIALGDIALCFSNMIDEVGPDVRICTTNNDV